MLPSIDSVKCVLYTESMSHPSSIKYVFHYDHKTVEYEDRRHGVKAPSSMYVKFNEKCWLQISQYTTVQYIDVIEYKVISSFAAGAAYDVLRYYEMEFLGEHSQGSDGCECGAVAVANATDVVRHDWYCNKFEDFR